MSAAPKPKVETSLNLYQKLVLVRKEVVYIQKTNPGGYGDKTFKYVTEADVLLKIRPKMDELGVLLIPHMLSLEPVEITCTRQKQIVKIPGVKVCFEFVWVNAENPTEQIKIPIIVQDSESEIDTIGGLMTYASKYFLFKFFNIPMDNDPDSSKVAEKKETQQVAQEKAKLDKTIQVLESALPSTEYVTIQQANELERLGAENPTLWENMKSYHKATSGALIPAADYDNLLKFFHEARARANNRR